MSCDLIEGRLDGARPAEIDAHMLACPSCRAMAAPGAEPGPGFAESVLARTSGPVCGSARRRLCDLVDGTLPDGEAALVRMHLSGCARCGALARTLEWSGRLLPTLASIDPGPDFTRRVLAATRTAALAARPGPILGRAPGRARGTSLSGRAAGSARPRRWLEAARARTVAMLERPRFAVEAAYAGAMLLWLIFGAGGSPLSAVPARALDLARIDPIEVARASLVPAIPDEAMSRLAAAPAEAARRAWSATGGALIRSAVRTAPTLPGRSAAAGRGALELGRHALRMFGATLGGDRAAGEAAWSFVKEDLRSIGSAISGSDHDTTNTTRED